MLVEASISLSSLLDISKIIGAITAAGGLFIGVFKVINWIKTKFISIDRNVVDLKNSMDMHITGLRDDIKEQTKTIATELREQRQDFRTFFAPTLIHLQAQQASSLAPVRAKNNSTRKPNK